MLHLSEIPDDIFLLNIAINSIKYYYIYFRFNRGKNNIIFLKFEKERIVMSSGISERCNMFRISERKNEIE
jgi:hypothetical protein